MASPLVLEMTRNQVVAGIDGTTHQNVVVKKVLADSSLMNSCRGDVIKAAVYHEDGTYGTIFMLNFFFGISQCLVPCSRNMVEDKDHVYAMVI